MTGGAPAAASGLQMLLGLGIGMAVLVLLVLRTRVPAFLALVVAASLTGLLAGLSGPAVAASISAGFGSTLGTIGIVIGLGVMLGEVLEVTGAARRMALWFLRRAGNGREDAALAATGFVVSIPIFCDSGFVILSPIARALSRATGKSVVTLGVALASGLVATHHAVPPTPGPLGAAGLFGADVGVMILWGVALAAPVVAVNVAYARWIGRKIYQVPDPRGDGWVRVRDEAEARRVLGLDESPAAGGADVDESALPSALRAFAPVVVPLLLIFANTALAALGWKAAWVDAFLFLGSPVIAVAIGLVLALYGLGGRLNRQEAIRVTEDGMKSAGIILLVTGAGGALGQVLRDSRTGDYVAGLIARTPFPPVLLPFLVATFVRLVQGSGTVAMIASASITAPILATSGVNPAIAAQAAALGAMVFSYFNDSYFWVVNRLLGVDEVKDQLRVWSVPTTIGWAVSGVLVTALSFVVPP
jgi:GntP family gluconate:H+ symporter